MPCPSLGVTLTEGRGPAHTLSERRVTHRESVSVVVGRAIPFFALRTKLKIIILLLFFSSSSRSTNSRNQCRKENIITTLFRNEDHCTSLRKALQVINTVRFSW